MEKINTFIVFPVIPDYIEAFLRTLHQFTPPNFQVIVVDQTKDGVYEIVKNYNPELYIRSYRNLGFSKAANTGAKLATTPYITIANDDVEFINSAWWQGIEDTFATDQKIIAVNPNSPKIAMWGYGMDHYTKFELLGKEECATEEGYNYLVAGDYSNHAVSTVDDKGERKSLPSSFPLKQTGVIDGIATWFTVFKRDFYCNLGGFDEKYYPGGGEDHDICARAYSKGYRMVGTMKSWVWHYWSSSRDHPEKLPPLREDLVWNNHDELWPPDLNGGARMDPWGHRTLSDGTKVPLKRVAEVHTIPLQCYNQLMAVIFDNSSENQLPNTTSLTVSHTCGTQLNRALFVFISTRDTTTDKVTGVTYNSVAMSRHNIWNDGTHTVYLYYLMAPSTGTNDIIISLSSANDCRAIGLSYFNAQQSGFPDANGTKAETGVTSITHSITTVLDNSWTLIFARGSTSAPTSYTGGTIRKSAGEDSAGDTNELKTPPGSVSVTANCPGNNNMMIQLTSFAPSLVPPFPQLIETIIRPTTRIVNLE